MGLLGLCLNGYIDKIDKITAASFVGLTCSSHISSRVVKASRREVGTRAQQMAASLPAEGGSLSVQVYADPKVSRAVPAVPQLYTKMDTEIEWQGPSCPQRRV